eukprot:scaffold76591_cov51-Prasinocladus_malaysianus.AAC.1
MIDNGRIWNLLVAKFSQFSTRPKATRRLRQGLPLAETSRYTTIDTIRKQEQEAQHAAFETLRYKQETSRVEPGKMSRGGVQHQEITDTRGNHITVVATGMSSPAGLQKCTRSSNSWITGNIADV